MLWKHHQWIMFDYLVWTSCKTSQVTGPRSFFHFNSHHPSIKPAVLHASYAAITYLSIVRCIVVRIDTLLDSLDTLPITSSSIWHAVETGFWEKPCCWVCSFNCNNVWCIKMQLWITMAIMMVDPHQTSPAQHMHMSKEIPSHNQSSIALQLCSRKSPLDKNRRTSHSIFGSHVCTFVRFRQYQTEHHQTTWRSTCKNLSSMLPYATDLVCPFYHQNS